MNDELMKAMTASHDRQNEVMEWETTSKLSLKSSKSSFNAYASEVQALSKSFQQNVDQFQQQFDVIAGKNLNNIDVKDKKKADLGNLKKKNNKNQKNANKNDNKKESNKYLAIIQQMNVVQDKLDIAQKSGVEAEKILVQAKAQGDREAAFYTKALAGVVPSTTTTGNANAATSSASISNSNKK